MFFEPGKQKKRPSFTKSPPAFSFIAAKRLASIQNQTIFLPASCRLQKRLNPMSATKPITLHLPKQTLPVETEYSAKLRQALTDTTGILFAVLIGSRANAGATENSDWDIAILWQYGDAMARIAKHELMRRRLALILETPDAQIDLIDLSNARLAMRALVAEEGCLLAVNDELAWTKFLTRTWRELEDFYWEQTYAA